ncbi:SDR family oxidoreductase [Plantactinospora sonchi]|uniref:SDR family oxidoreductase n=1 Tax=Plantactinospora sonchi TaxID=1544735 RepID=A0ABU7RX05_9ACTN
MGDRLAGRVSVVTGAGSGIGLATVRRLAAEGARVVCVDIDAGPGRAAAWEVDGDFVECDVADEAAVRELFDGVAARHGRIDIAVNNAGISPPGDDPVRTAGPDARERVIKAIAGSLHLCCRYVIPHMLRQGGGSIVNTAPFLAPADAATPQIASAAREDAVLALTRELGVEFARQGIRVTAVRPGPVATGPLAEPSAADPERAARRLAHVPMGRFGEPTEIAAAIAFLASDDASFMTAAQLVVDGGITGAHVTPR